ncbi:hypothetical protein [Agrococcus sediminis]|uniref:hypothetical protein n=1 Tax=Agrococcus sediminis TaxID=2599924 RepID=UPI003431EE93
MAGPLRVEHDVEVGRWLQAALGPFGTVGAVVPPVFEAYARILHPATLSTPTGETDAWGAPVQSTREITWAEAAELVGDRAAPGEPWTAWSARFGEQQLAMPDGGWLTEPTGGDIPLPTLTTLTELLLDEHGDAEVLVAVWEGSGLDPSSTSTFWPIDPSLASSERLRRHREAEAAHRELAWAAIDPAVRAAMEQQRLLGLPRERQGRGHVLLRGRLSAFADPAWVETAGLGWREGDWVDRGRTPNAVWPAEPHGAPAWMVATDLDLDVTFVGGSAHLVGRVLAHPSLEAERARPEDPLV